MSNAQVPPQNSYDPQTEVNPLVQKVMDASVEQMNYELIVIVVVIADGMMGPSIDINDYAQISTATTDMTNDLNTINTELTDLESAIVPNGSSSAFVYTDPATGQKVTIDINPALFNKTDLNNLCDAFSDLYYGNPQDGPASSWSITVSGTIYYPQQDGTWSTTPPTGNASDIQVYMFYVASSECDADVLAGKPIDTTTIFYTDPSDMDGNLQSLETTFNKFNQTFSSSDTYNTHTLAYYMNEYAQGVTNPDGTVTPNEFSNTTDETAFVHQMGGLADNYNASLSSGQSSDLSDMVGDVTQSTTTLNSFSQEIANKTNQDIQNLQSIDSTGQAIIKDGAQAIQSSINGQKAAAG